MGADNLAHPTGIRSPDRPTRSESLYRLSYPGPLSDIYREKSGEYDAVHWTASRVPCLRTRGTLPPLFGMTPKYRGGFTLPMYLPYQLDLSNVRD